MHTFRTPCRKFQSFLRSAFRRENVLYKISRAFGAFILHSKIFYILPNKEPRARRHFP